MYVMSDVLVLVSTYNGENYLREQLDSILAQSIPVDILVRDDGSKDTTLAILQEYMDTHDNIRYVRGENKGFVGSFIELMKMAKGYSYYSFSDQDDVWFHDKVETAVGKLKELDQRKPCVYASCSLLVDNDMNGDETTQINRKGMDFYNIIIQNLMPGHTQVVNQAMIDFVLTHPFDITKIFVHDYWIALIGIIFGEFYFDNEYHTYYRQHNDNSLGYGHGTFGWITERIHHVVDGAARQITRQDQFFYDNFKDMLTKEQCKELEGLLNSQRNIFTRTVYLCKARVYRQRNFETTLFYVLYLLGGYKV